ncbi:MULTISPECIES: S1 RNA-binding domain-containing protein [unclassified Streptococcus]|uniref:S1 RNA-binding domain-containing protein n=1 Tax=unclassified Streptococcus TaxID=2608887 RepID=UPI0011B6E0A1|nr:MULTISPECIES: S1 RNA-binding domain-containing protein [unclassified Streptococcus]TWS94404.1 S1 RNA-binding domain-containing protein [Streptococcus sp. sy018]TWT14678.1 S1 RNA-binding domain-containing protein [Streptococcus sp. sy010]
MKIGDKLNGQIVGIKPYGAFVELEKDKIGLIHISEVKAGYIDNIYKNLSVGQKVTVQIIDLDEYSQKISLSLRSLEEEGYISQPKHRFSNSRYKIGFKPLAKALPNWIDESLAFLKKDTPTN